jgi:hypothetical protein
MRSKVFESVAIAAAMIYTVPIVAHHSFAAVFDRESPIELTGTVTEVEWMNPHAWIYIDVERENGEIENWGFEMGSPSGLIRRGWNHDSLQVGQVITVMGVRARDGSQRGAVRTVTLSTGESLFGAQDESR